MEKIWENYFDLKKKYFADLICVCHFTVFHIALSSLTESAGKPETVPLQMKASVIYLNQILRAHSSISFSEF